MEAHPQKTRRARQRAHVRSRARSVSAAKLPAAAGHAARRDGRCRQRGRGGHRARDEVAASCQRGRTRSSAPGAAYRPTTGETPAIVRRRRAPPGSARPRRSAPRPDRRAADRPGTPGARGRAGARGSRAQRAAIPSPISSAPMTRHTTAMMVALLSGQPALELTEEARRPLAHREVDGRPARRPERRGRARTRQAPRLVTGAVPVRAIAAAAPTVE